MFARDLPFVPAARPGLIWTRIVSFELHSRTRGVIVGFLPDINSLLAEKRTGIA